MPLKLTPALIAVKDLSVLHDKHLNRPTLDDSVDEEHAIEIQTQDITQVRGRRAEGHLKGHHGGMVASLFLDGAF